MTVELRDGPFYRSFAYSNPNAHKGAAFRAATAIGRIDDGLWTLMMPLANDRVMRGRLAIGRRAPEFVPCGSTETWGATYAYAPAIDSVRRTFPETDTLSRQMRYAELRGMEALPALVRSRGGPYTHVLEIDSVLAVRKWAEAECGRK